VTAGVTVTGMLTLAPTSPSVDLLDRLRADVIGDGAAIAGPYGPRPTVYVDHTASGRALGMVEEYLRRQVLPRYANTHTESSSTGRAMGGLREQARELILREVGGTDEHAVIFCGSGVTAAIHKLAAMLPLTADSVVLVGPYEHHSNELIWRESPARVVVVDATPDGQLDLGCLLRLLESHKDAPLLVGSFSAASNVTGLITDIDHVSSMLTAYGAVACWDYASAGPYLPIRMADKDAVFLSPHKFVGGPGTPGVLIVRRDLLRNRVPTVPGGGTVDYVNPYEHHYIADPAHREEGGTPGIVESIRAGLVFGLKQAVGTDVIRAHEEQFLHRAVDQWRRNENMQILGNVNADRLSILSFVVKRPHGLYLHHNFVVALLHDLFGVQSRGGCSCAGPYGHRLLGIDLDRSHRFEQEIVAGCEGIKPGWVRVSFNYFISEATFSYIVDAVDLVASHGWLLLPEYRFNPTTGLWRHRGGLVEPPLRLSQLTYGADGRLRSPARFERAPESALAEYLAEARELFGKLADQPSIAVPGAGTRARVSAGFEELRWFDLPDVCLTGL